jgi:hypothetical protein
MRVEQLKKRLDALDRRLDDIDTMVSAIAERAMNRPISIALRHGRQREDDEMTV